MRSHYIASAARKESFRKFDRSLTYTHSYVAMRFPTVSLIELEPAQSHTSVFLSISPVRCVIQQKQSTGEPHRSMLANIKQGEKSDVSHYACTHEWL